VTFPGGQIFELTPGDPNRPLNEQEEKEKEKLILEVQRLLDEEKRRKHRKS
jgi:hypothetical protein